MDRFVLHVHGNVTFHNDGACIRNSHNIRGSIVQDAFNSEEILHTCSTCTAPSTYPNAPAVNRRMQDDEREKRESGHTSSHSSTAQAHPDNLDAYPPAIPYGTKPAVVVSPEFHHSTPAQTQWLDGDLNDEPKGRSGDQARHYYLSGEGGCRAPKCEKRGKRTQAPSFPVPSISSPPPTVCTCSSYEGNATSHLVYAMPVPIHASSHSTLCTLSPTAEVTALRHDEWPAPPKAYVSHPIPSPPTPPITLLNTIARLNSTPTTFTSDLQSPHPYGGPNRSATFAGTSSSPAPGFPVPQFHSPSHQP